MWNSQQCAVSVGRFLYLNSFFFSYIQTIRTAAEVPHRSTSYGHIAKMILCMRARPYPPRVLTKRTASHNLAYRMYLYEEYRWCALASYCMYNIAIFRVLALLYYVWGEVLPIFWGGNKLLFIFGRTQTVSAILLGLYPIGLTTSSRRHFIGNFISP